MFVNYIAWVICWCVWHYCFATICSASVADLVCKEFCCSTIPI